MERSRGTTAPARIAAEPAPGMENTADVLVLRHVSKKYRSVTAVDDVSFSVRKGEFVSILGPSGCGKTTLLRIIAGFTDPDAAAVEIDGVSMNGVPPHRRNTAMVFQNYALFPHISVFDNIAFGLRMRRLSYAEIDARVRDGMRLVRLKGLEDRMPGQLSGGQQQRVALARALVVQPTVLLLDEPLSNLDAKLREEMRIELKQLQRQIGLTMVYVTHDQEEALAMSDRVIVMNLGVIEQIGSPAEIYERPRTEFVADFIGTSNFFKGVVEIKEGVPIVSLDGGGLLRLEPTDQLKSGERVLIAVRPEKMTVVAADAEGSADVGNAFRATIENIAYLGPVMRLLLRVFEGGREVLVDASSTRETQQYRVGEKVMVLIDPGTCFRVKSPGV